MKNLKDILDKHAKWARDEEGGERANLREANLRGANLRGANLAQCRNFIKNITEFLSGGSENHYDLCPRCLQQLKESLNNSSEANPDEKKP